MAAPNVINVDHIIDGQSFRAFNLLVVVCCFLVLMCDGYDLTVIAFAMPGIVKDWHITNMAMLGPVFSAAIFGVLCGGPVLGYVSDRIGRKPTLILSALGFGIFCLLTAFAESLNQLLVLRFLSGIGLGGVLPIGAVLSGEFAPLRLRARMMTASMTGIVIGAGLPGIVAAGFMSTYGWRVLFLVGGIAPIVMALALPFLIPESVKFLVLRPARKPELARVLRRLQPGVVVNAATDEFVSHERTQLKPSARYLFAGRYALLTPLLWVGFIVAGIVVYFIQSWTPTLLTNAGLPITQAAIATTMFQSGGVFGGFLVGWPVDKFGIKPITVLFLIGIPVIALVGLPGMPRAYLFGALFLAGAVILAIQNGLNALSAMIYPTFIRGNGVGWGLAVVRLGQISGTLIGGVLIANGMSVQNLFYLLAMPMAVAAASSWLLARAFRGVEHPVPASVGEFG